MISSHSQKPPFFSIVMPVCNAEAYVGHAIESVLVQSDPDWEFVIVDDFSGDRTPEILERYAKKDARIRLLRNGKNLNIAASLNRGIRIGRGKWIVRIDADDFFNPHYLETLHAYVLRNLQSCFFSSWITAVDESGVKILDIQLPPAERVQRMMKIENFLYHPATSFPKALWKKVGGYPQKNGTIAEDAVLWNKFFEAGARLVMIPEFLVNYRIHYSNITSRNDAQLGDSSGAAAWKSIRQNREWRTSLYLKQKKLKMARTEILTLGWMQKRFSLKNFQYFLLTFLPESFVHFFMWEFRPRARAFIKNFRGRSIRI